MQYAGGHHHNTTEQGQNSQALRRRSDSTLSENTAMLYSCSVQAKNYMIL